MKKTVNDVKRHLHFHCIEGSCGTLMRPHGRMPRCSFRPRLSHKYSDSVSAETKSLWSTARLQIWTLLQIPNESAQLQDKSPLLLQSYGWLLFIQFGWSLVIISNWTLELWLKWPLTSESSNRECLCWSVTDVLCSWCETAKHPRKKRRRLPSGRQIPSLLYLQTPPKVDKQNWSKKSSSMTSLFQFRLTVFCKIY